MNVGCEWRLLSLVPGVSNIALPTRAEFVNDWLLCCGGFVLRTYTVEYINFSFGVYKVEGFGQ